MDKIEKETEVAIIGGGIVGASIAYCLAKGGKKDVTLIERKELASEASGASAAGVMLCLPPPRPLLVALASRSLKAFANLSEDLGRDIDYVTPRITVIEDESALGKYSAYCDTLHKLGHPEMRIIDRAEIIKFEPSLTFGKHALLDPDGGHVNCLYLVTALGDKARELGAKVYEHTEVLNIKQGKGHVKSVVTNRGEIQCEYVVNAAGYWAPRIGEMVGLRIPITPLKAIMLATEELPPVSHIGCLGSAAYFAADQIAGGLEIYPIYRQMGKGEILIGITEEPGEDKWAAFENIQGICRGVGDKLLPYLKDMRVNIVTSFGNLYAVTPDRLPILGPVEGLEGFIMATGFNDYGIGHGYGAGEVIAELISTGETSIPIGEATFSRFSC